MSNFDPVQEGLPGWVKQPPPPCLQFVQKGERERTFAKFSALAELANAKSDEGPNDAPSVFLRPRATFKRWSMPGGIAGSEDEENELHVSFEQVLMKLFPEGLFMWAPGNEQYGMFKGEFRENARSWLKNEFILSPLALMSDDARFVMICDEQMRFCVVGAAPEIAGEILDALGGESLVRQTMDDYIADYGVGFGDDHRRWALSNLINL